MEYLKPSLEDRSIGSARSVWTNSNGFAARASGFLFLLSIIFPSIQTLQSWAELFKAGLREPRVSAMFEFRYESLESISVLILFVYKLMIGSSKNSTENYPRKCFWTQEKETWVKFNPGLSANRPSNNWALGFTTTTIACFHTFYYIF